MKVGEYYKLYNDGEILTGWVVSVLNGVTFQIKFLGSYYSAHYPMILINEFLENKTLIKLSKLELKLLDLKERTNEKET